MEKWSTTETIKFLEKYGEYSCLWDYNSKDYRNRNKRLAALQELAAHMNMPNFDSKQAQQKIHSLRNTYLAEKKKVLQSSKSGSGVHDIYVPKLPWYDIANTFLQKIVQTRKSESNLDSHKTLGEGCEEAGDGSIDAPDTLEEGTLNEATFSSAPNEQGKDETMPTAATTMPIGPLGKRRRQKSSTSEDFSPLTSAVSALRELKCKVKESEFESFGRSVVDQLDKLPLAMAYDVQAQIQNILTNKKIEALRMKEGTSSMDRVSTPLSTDSVFLFSPDSVGEYIEVSQDENE